MVEVLVLAPILILAVVTHEVAHGVVALRLGDPTAKDMGRLTANPIKHVSLFGTIILPLMLVLVHSPFIFAWAKPVPINPSYFRKPRQGMGLVGAAGPAVNFILASAFALLYRLLHFAPAFAGFPVVKAICEYGVVINLVLAMFNLFPVPPLDGSRILAALLPEGLARVYARLEPFGLLLVILLLYFGAFRWLVVPMVHMASLLLGEEVSLT